MGKLNARQVVSAYLPHDDTICGLCFLALRIITVEVPVGAAVSVGVGREGVMLKTPVVEELFWTRMSLAILSNCSWVEDLPEDAAAELQSA
jgi:hypothetical protein